MQKVYFIKMHLIYIIDFMETRMLTLETVLWACICWLKPGPNC